MVGLRILITFAIRLRVLFSLGLLDVDAYMKTVICRSMLEVIHGQQGRSIHVQDWIVEYRTMGNHGRRFLLENIQMQNSATMLPILQRGRNPILK